MIDELIERHESAVRDAVGGNVLTMGEVSLLVARIRTLEAGLAALAELLNQDGGWCNHGVLMDRPYHPRCSHCVLNQARALLAGGRPGGAG